MEDRVYKIKMYLYDEPVLDDIYFYQNDTNTCTLEFEFYRNRKDYYDLSNSSVVLIITKNDGTSITETLTSINGVYQYELSNNAIDNVGNNKITIQAIGQNNDRVTFGSFKYKLTKDTVIGNIASDTNYPILVKLISDANNVITNEPIRITNENIRIENEVKRIANDGFREKDYASLKSIIIDENQAANLQNQINTSNSQLADIEQQKASKSEVGSPLIANDTSGMIDKTKVYVNITNGKWYSWNGTIWDIGGTYNSQGVGDGTITPVKTTFIKTYLNTNILSETSYIDNITLNTVGASEPNNNYFTTSKGIPVKPNTTYIFSQQGKTEIVMDSVVEKDTSVLNSFTQIGGRKINISRITTSSTTTFLFFSKYKDTINIGNIANNIYLQENTISIIPENELQGIKVPYIDSKLATLEDKIPKTYMDKFSIKDVEYIQNVSVENITVSEWSKTSVLTKSYTPKESADISNIFKYSSPFMVKGTGFPRELTVHEKNSKPYSVEFVHYGEKLEINQFGNAYGFLLEVDNKYVGEYTPTTADGESWYKLFEFEKIKHRNIKIYTRGESYFYNLKTDNVGSIYSINQKRPLLIAEGDSIVEGGASANEQRCSIPAILSKLFDFDMVNTAVGGTGYVVTLGKTKLLDRIPLVKTYNPQFMLVLAGFNDRSTPILEVESAISTYFSTLKTELPNTQVIAISPFNPYVTIPNELIPINKKVKEEALKNGYAFIDTLNGTTYDKYGNILISGLSPMITNGNKEIFIDKDLIHPKREGALCIGIRISQEFNRILNS